MVRSFSINALFAFAVVTAFAATAAAQNNPEDGDTGAWQQGNQGQWQGQGQPPQQQQGWGQPPPQQTPPQQQGWNNGGASRGDGERPGNVNTENDDVQTGTDHSLAVGHIGVGFFGTQGVPYSDAATLDASAPLPTLSAPTVGVRYWFSEGLGLDVALGFGFRTSSVASGNGASVGLGSALAFALHGGLPINLYSGKHYKFLIVPELTVGFATGSVPSRMAADSSDNFGGFMLNVGARAGTEIHFGFIGIPELSLQASVGLGLGFQSLTSDQCTNADCSNSAQGSFSSLTLGTSVQNRPWDIFVGNVSAIYYIE